ncbi:hypothetical protein GH141_06765, partial [bacterium]|nr:hypothetical protein [bacterium]
MLRAKRLLAGLVLGTLLVAAPATGSIDTTKVGKSLGLEFAPGMMGSLSFMQVGVNLPTIGKSFQIGIKGRMCSSLTWATFIDQETGLEASFHPVTAAGVISFGGSGPIIHGAVRPYGATDILLGYTFS